MSEEHLDKDQANVMRANLDKCTDGDVEFRRELALLLANNMTELLANVEKALALNDPTILVRAVHKTKTTLSILADNELSEGLNTLQAKLGTEAAAAETNDHVHKLSLKCKKTISLLNALSTQE